VFDLAIVGWQSGFMINKKPPSTSARSLVFAVLLSFLGACSTSSITMEIEVEATVPTEVIAQGADPSVTITNEGEARVEVSGPEKGEQARTLSRGQSMTRRGASPLHIHLTTNSPRPVWVRVAARGVRTLATTRVEDPR
jgi:hypothetical protein